MTVDRPSEGSVVYLVGGFRRSGRNYGSPEGVWRFGVLGSSISLENVVALWILSASSLRVLARRAHDSIISVQACEKTF